MINKKPFRQQTDWEKAILARLMATSFPDQNKLSMQVRHARVRQISDYKDNYGSFEFQVQPSANQALNAPARLYAVATDADNVPFEAILHLRNGYIRELELIKADGSRLLQRPNALDFKITRRKEAG